MINYKLVTTKLIVIGLGINDFRRLADCRKAAFQKKIVENFKVALGVCQQFFVMNASTKTLSVC